MDDSSYAFNKDGKAGKQTLRDPGKKHTNRLEDLIKTKDRYPK